MNEKDWSFDELRNPLKPYHDTFEDPDHPNVLFHYTDAQAFFAILETRSLLLGRLSAMNDTKEHSWLREIAREIARDRHYDLQRKPNKTKEDGWKVSYYTALMVFLGQPVRSDPYCTCFSVRGDLLSQWRAYADDACGFAIGFSTTALMFGGDNPVQVVYKPGLHRQWIESLFDFFSDGESDLVTAADLAAKAEDRISSIAMYCKNSHFDEEAEFRLVHDAGPEMGFMIPRESYRRLQINFPMTSEFTVRGRNIRHYLRLPFNESFGDQGREAIKTIVIGPKNPITEHPEVLRRFLQERGYHHLLGQVFLSSGTLR